jgi:hypothetical protein
LLFSIVAFVYNCTLLTSDSDKYPWTLIGFRLTIVNKIFPGVT